MESYESLFGYRPDLTFTLEQHLKNFAECEENARRLLESFHIIREKMEVNLRPVIALFPHYSEHSHEHSEHIIAAVEKLLGNKRIEKLSPADTWMLLVSAYMHDLGMLVQGKELEADWDTPQFQRYLEGCAASSDEEIRRAAANVRDTKQTGRGAGWPVTVYRDVILLVSEFYRRRHPERARTLPDRAELKQSLHVVMSSDGKIPPRIQDVVGKICSAHGLSFAELLALLEPVDSLLGYVFHPRFIAAMLCLGDLCDLDNSRFNEMALEVFGGVTKKNLVHYYKHESVTSFVMQKDRISVIFDISSRKIRQELKQKKYAFENPTEPELQDFCDAVLLETQNWLGWMEDIVQNIKLHWDKFAYPELEAFSPSLQYKILVDGQETLSSRKNLRFSFSNEKAYELIESYSLYNNRLIFIRELLQNSMDALKRQFWADIRSGRWNHLLKHLEKDGGIPYREIQPFDFSDPGVFDQYQVRIEVTHQEGQPSALFTITDNGTGISREDVENRILRTGFRQENAAAEEEMPQWLRPTSAFGIGLHSVFAVTDTIFVQTKTETDPLVYNLNMHSGKRDGYVFMSIADRQDLRFCNCMRGTRMQFSVDVEGCRNALESWKKEYGYREGLFEKRPESDFCRVLQEILSKWFQTSLFAVACRFNEEWDFRCKALYQNRYWKLLFRRERRNYIFEERIPDSGFDFALHTKENYLVVWDRKRAISAVYYLDGERNGDCEIYCKGFRVENTEIERKRFDLTPDILDFWGGNTGDIVNVSRDRLSQKQMQENGELFENIGSFVIRIYLILLGKILKDESVQKWHKDIEEFMKPWMGGKVEGGALPGLSERLSEYAEKYSCFLLSQDEIKKMILRHGFCLLLQRWRGQVGEILNAFDREKRTDYVLGCQLFAEEKEENKTIKEQTYIFEFVDRSLKSCEDVEEKSGLKYLYQNIFRGLFAAVWINSGRDFDYEYTDFRFRAGQFGKIYAGEFWNFAQRKLIKWKEERLEKETSGYCPAPLDFYFAVPFTELLYRVICAGVGIDSLKDAILSELSYVPGYYDTYGFLDMAHVGDIMMSPRLTIKAKYFNQKLCAWFPFLEWMVCEAICIDKDGELLFGFGRRHGKEKEQLVEYKDGSLFRILSSYAVSMRFPVPAGYEAIAVKQEDPWIELFEEGGNEIGIYSDYTTCLWGRFSNLSHQYGPRIASGESKEAIADEIMPCSRTDDKPVLYLLRYIYHHRAFHKDLRFEEAWQKICETYRRFILLVLDYFPAAVPEEENNG